MSSPNVRMVRIEAENAEDAMQQIRAQLGNEIPEELVQMIGKRFAERTENNSSDNDKAFGELLSTIGSTPPEVFAKLDSIAEAIADTPREQRFAALEAAVMQMGEAFGFSPEKTAELANQSKERVNKALEAIGVNTTAFSETFGAKQAQAQEVKGQASGERAVQSKPELGAAYGTGTSLDQARQREKASIAKLRAHGYSREAICHIGQFYKNQDSLIDALADLFHLADFEGDHKHLPSARLFEQLDSYIVRSNEMVYGMLNNAGVDPTTVGFAPEAQWRQDYAETADLRERVRKTVSMYEPVAG